MSGAKRRAYRRPGEATAAVRAAGKAAERRPSAMRELLGLAMKIASIAGIALIVFNFVFGLHYNADPSMSPSIRDGDLVLYYRFDKAYRAGDLLLLKYGGSAQIRRVVATAGDTVDITADGLVVNGALQSEPEIYQSTERYAEGIEFPVTVGEGEVFVLADARENATDSRVYAAVSVGDTQGAVIAVLRRRSL